MKQKKTTIIFIFFFMIIFHGNMVKSTKDCRIPKSVFPIILKYLRVSELKLLEMTNREIKAIIDRDLYLQYFSTSLNFWIPSSHPYLFIKPDQYSKLANMDKPYHYYAGLHFYFDRPDGYIFYDLNHHDLIVPLENEYFILCEQIYLPVFFMVKIITPLLHTHHFTFSITNLQHIFGETPNFAILCNFEHPGSIFLQLRYCTITGKFIQVSICELIDPETNQLKIINNLEEYTFLISMQSFSSKLVSIIHRNQHPPTIQTSVMTYIADLFNSIYIHMK